MQAISVKWLGPTNYRVSRVKAECAAGSLTLSADYSLSGEAVYQQAADALVSKLGWTDPHYGKLVGGQLKNGCYVFVFCKGDR